MPQDPSQATHFELIQRSADGDSDAFRQLYEETFDDVYRYVSSRAHASSIDDVVAETYLRAFRSAATFENRGRPVIAWLVTIARNALTSDHSQRQKQQRSLKRTGDDRTAASIEEVAVDLEDRDSVLAGLETLKERPREVLTLRFIDQMSVSEVAREMSLTEEGVRALTYRSLKALRAHLESS